MHYLIGWLLKGRCDVSALDGLMLLFELFILFWLFLLGAHFKNKFQRGPRRGK